MSIGTDISKAGRQQMQGHRLHSSRNSDEFRDSGRLKFCFGEQNFDLTFAAFRPKNCQYHGKSPSPTYYLEQQLPAACTLQQGAVKPIQQSLRSVA